MKTKSRREFLIGAGAVMPVAATAALASESVPKKSAFIACPRATGGPNATHFPRTVVQDQHRRKSWFYQDLVRGKLVLISFTSVWGEKRYPILNNLVEVQKMLGDRFEKDVFMYTFTTDPRRDGPDELKKLAEVHGARWRFFGGESDAVREVLTSFNVRGRLNALTWIGNEQTGRWIRRPSRQRPLEIVELVARLSTGDAHKPFLVDRHSVYRQPV